MYCFNSATMYAYSEKIVRALVEHYKNEEAIVAWQIDNEIGHEGSDICYCENCQKKFQQYLSETFQGQIDRLNDTYGTTFCLRNTILSMRFQFRQRQLQHIIRHFVRTGSVSEVK